MGGGCGAGRGGGKEDPVLLLPRELLAPRPESQFARPAKKLKNPFPEALPDPELKSPLPNVLPEEYGLPNMPPGWSPPLGTSPTEVLGRRDGNKGCGLIGNVGCTPPPLVTEEGGGEETGALGGGVETGALGSRVVTFVSGGTG